MKPVSPFGLPIGISATFWLVIGFFRFVHRWIESEKVKKIPDTVTAYDIAVLLPAHNEELVIKRSIRALKRLVGVRQIYVISDGSTDKTVEIAKSFGCRVSSVFPGKGKAKALVYGIKKYRLFQRYKCIFIVDADTKIDRNFIKGAIEFFKDPEIGVVFGSAKITWPKHIIPKLGLYYVAYRERLNRILQCFYIYGQTWKYTNATYVIPGFATIYRSDVLKQLEIDTPGLLVEDFNLGFQVHKKRLTKIGYHPSLIGWDQHPNNLIDYWKQVRRWNIAFFQTVRKNGIWPSFFWLSLGIFTLEVFLNSVFILLAPFILVSLVIPLPLIRFWEITLLDFLFAVFLYDYIMTIIVAALTKKPQFIMYGVFFFFMHYVTSLILITSIIPGFFKSSDGRWKSPARRREK